MERETPRRLEISDVAVREFSPSSAMRRESRLSTFDEIVSQLDIQLSDFLANRFGRVFKKAPQVPAVRVGGDDPPFRLDGVSTQGLADLRTADDGAGPLLRRLNPISGQTMPLELGDRPAG